MLKLNDFPDLTTLANDDLLLAWDSSASITSKVQLSVLKAFLVTTNNTSSSTK